MRTASPLRYPGGKWRVAPFFERLIAINGLDNVTYVEPYAGGASLALTLLFEHRVSEIYLNDLDPAIHACWQAIINRTPDLIEFIRAVPVTPEEWYKQKAIYANSSKASKFRLGCATLFLNRTNHSGILNGGMIGGKKQTGEWKLDARFNRTALIERIRQIATARAKIHVSCRDALDVLRDFRHANRTLIYLDPPYYHPAYHLYMNAYKHHDHVEVRRALDKVTTPWVISYDDTAEIRRLYTHKRCRKLRLLHTARTARDGAEIIYFADMLRIPRLQIGPTARHSVGREH
jgi:DNA adenine methylase